jgi:hypothetical protein
MNLSRFFTVTYFASYRGNNSMHDRFSKFWIWNAPHFIVWVNEKGEQIRKKTGEDIVVTSCNKI